jgi:hypothetical protein
MDRPAFNRFDRNTRVRLNRFDLVSRVNVDVIRFDPNSGLHHKAEVIRLAQEALEQGEHFITRARLDPRVCGEELVADFYNIDWNTVYEVADTEGHKSLDRKARLWRALGFHFHPTILRLTPPGPR